MHPLTVAAIIATLLVVPLFTLLYRVARAPVSAAEEAAADVDSNEEESDYSQEIEETIAQYIKEQEDQFYDKLYNDINMYRERIYEVEERNAALQLLQPLPQLRHRRRNSL